MFLATEIAGLVPVEQTSEQFFHFRPAIGIDAVADRHAFYGSLYESEFFQFPQVLADGGLCQSEFFHQVAVDGRAFASSRYSRMAMRAGAPAPGIAGQFVLLFGKDGLFW